MAVVLPLWGMVGIWTDTFGWVVHLFTSNQDRTLLMSVLEDIIISGSFGRTTYCSDFSKRRTIHFRKR
jgi:hypothetical protein